MKKVVSILLIISSLFVLSASLFSYADNSSTESTENTEKIQRKIKIEEFFSKNKKYLPKDKILKIRSMLENLSDYELEFALNMEFTRPGLMTLTSIFLGPLGIDRFIAGDFGMGLLKLGLFILNCTGMLGVLSLANLLSGNFITAIVSPLLSLTSGSIIWLHDIFTASGRTKQANYEHLLNVLP